MPAAGAVTVLIGTAISTPIEAGVEASEVIPASFEVESRWNGDARVQIAGLDGILAAIHILPDLQAAWQPTALWDIFITDASGREIFTDTELSNSAFTKNEPYLPVSGMLNFLLTNMGASKRATVAIYVAAVPTGT